MHVLNGISDNLHLKSMTHLFLLDGTLEDSDIHANATQVGSRSDDGTQSSVKNGEAAKEKN